MDIEKIKAVMTWMAAFSLTELELTEGDLHIRLVKDAEGAVHPALTIEPGSRQAGDAPAGMPEPPTRKAECAPIFGVVHLASAPGEPDFVGIGKSVKAGETLCLVEAMKVFTSVDAQQDGIVADVLVKAGSEVAMGQPLFVIEARPL